MNTDFDMISRSTLQQSQIERLKTSFPSPTKPKPPSQSSLKPRSTGKLSLFNEIFLYGLSSKNEFQTIDCLWEHANSDWMDRFSISEKVAYLLSNRKNTCSRANCDRSWRNGKSTRRA